MNIVVCYKIVPDEQDAVVQADRTLSFERAALKIGDYDLNAVEAGAQLATAHGASLICPTAGGDAVHLMTDWTETLSAISAGAVFMGAVTYIGNAPNFMVRSIAEDQGVKMPSFFGYMLWSVGILFPCFALITYLFFM